MNSPHDRAALTRAAFPHSEISGSQAVSASPELIAADHVLLRLSAPEHPPHTLTSLTTEFGLRGGHPRVPHVPLRPPKGTEWALVIVSRFLTWNPCSDFKDLDPGGLRRASPWARGVQPSSPDEESGRRPRTGGKRPCIEAGYPDPDVYLSLERR
jgi:hypothetical protein